MNDSFRKRISGQNCIYCGELSNSDEHFSPKSYFLGGLILPSCRECNSMIGTSYFDNLKDRSDYAKNKLRIKYQKYLKVPDWNDDELSEISVKLKRQVKEFLIKKKWIENRLSWDTLAYIGKIDEDGFYEKMLELELDNQTQQV